MVHTWSNPKRPHVPFFLAGAPPKFDRKLFILNSTFKSAKIIAVEGVTSGNSGIGRKWNREKMDSGKNGIGKKRTARTTWTITRQDRWRTRWKRFDTQHSAERGLIQLLGFSCAKIVYHTPIRSSRGYISHVVIHISCTIVRLWLYDHGMMYKGTEFW